MSSVTKPIILDETGQDIVSKLDEIVDAIEAGGGGGGGGASTLGDLTDVTITSPVKNNVLGYNANQGIWKNYKNPIVSFGFLNVNGVWENVPYDTLGNAIDDFATRLKTAITTYYGTLTGSLLLMQGSINFSCDPNDPDYSNVSCLQGPWNIFFVTNNQCSVTNPSLYGNVLLEPANSESASHISKIHISSFGTEYAQLYILAANGETSSEITTNSTGIYISGANITVLHRLPADP